MCVCIHTVCLLLLLNPTWEDNPQYGPLKTMQTCSLFSCFKSMFLLHCFASLSPSLLVLDV